MMTTSEGRRGYLEAWLKAAVLACMGDPVCGPLMVDFLTSKGKKVASDKDFIRMHDAFNPFAVNVVENDAEMPDPITETSMEIDAKSPENNSMISPPAKEATE